MIQKLRKEDKPTVPTTIGLEKATNPFLRVSEPSIQTNLGMLGSSNLDVFTEIRRQKDNF